MRRFYKTSLISALVCILFFNEGAASAFEFKNPFKKKNKSNVQKLKDKNSKIQEIIIFQQQQVLVYLMYFLLLYRHF